MGENTCTGELEMDGKEYWRTINSAKGQWFSLCQVVITFNVFVGNQAPESSESRQV